MQTHATSILFHAVLPLITLVSCNTMKILRTNVITHFPPILSSSSNIRSPSCIRATDGSKQQISWISCSVFLNKRLIDEIFWSELNWTLARVLRILSFFFDCKRHSCLTSLNIIQLSSSMALLSIILVICFFHAMWWDDNSTYWEISTLNPIIVITFSGSAAQRGLLPPRLRVLLITHNDVPSR
jgi:hypothetical protein